MMNWWLMMMMMITTTMATAGFFDINKHKDVNSYGNIFNGCYITPSPFYLQTLAPLIHSQVNEMTRQWIRCSSAWKQRQLSEWHTVSFITIYHSHNYLLMHIHDTRGIFHKLQIQRKICISVNRLRGIRQLQTLAQITTAMKWKKFCSNRFIRIRIWIIAKLNFH